MTAAELLNQLSERGVKLWADGGALRFRAPRGALTPELRDAVRRSKGDLLRKLSPAPSPGVDEDLPTIRPDPGARHEPFPLTDLQEAYWLGSRVGLELGGISPHAYVEYDLPKVDLVRLNAAWLQMIARHDMLRARILPDGRQQVLPEVPAYSIPVTDLRSIPFEEQKARIVVERQRMGREGPSAEAWPLFEMQALRLGEAHYRLCWSSSLLLCDEWSYHVLTSEWFRLYDDSEASLTPLEVSFRDYVIASRAFEESPAWRDSFVWWQRRLAEMPSAPALPLRQSPAAVGTPYMRRRSARLEPTRWQHFKERCRTVGATPSAVLCTAFGEVLAAWSAHRRFTMNLLFFNRLPVHEKIPQLVGNFSSTVLLPMEFDTALSFGERVVDTQRRLWQHIRHSRVSGVRVLRELARERGTALTAGAPVVFASNLNAVGETEQDDVVFGPEGARTVHTHLQTSQVWLDHQAFEVGGGLHYNWDAVEELLPESLVDDLFAAYLGLVERLADDSRAWEQPVRDLTPKAQLERARRVNATALDLPRQRLETPFRDCARRHPERPALIDGDGSWSYGRLSAAAAALARRLQAHGVSADRPVAVVLPKSPQQALATLGIMASGAPYLPVDPNLPAQRFAHLLRRAGAVLAVTSAEQDRLAWPAEVERVVLDTENPEDADWPEAILDDEALAYILYTSGSTGEPKGVAIAHRGAVNTIQDIHRRFEVGPEDRALALSSLSFDLSVYDLFGMLGVGGAVVYPDPVLDREPAHWLELLGVHGVTIWNSVPALAEMLVAHCEGRGEPLPPSLRLFLLSGDWIPVNLPDRIRTLQPEARVISLGGATEASIWSIFHPIETVDPSASSIPYGRPLANQTFQVLDEIGESRPMGVPGQLYIGGVGLAREYWRDSERTTAAFSEHPVTGERLYRTGDLGRWTETDEIEFLGREDSQVKIQGHRIELGEVETVLEGHPAIRQAAAAALGEKRGAKRLVAYAVPTAGTSLESAALTEFLADRLPSYMVPSHLLILDELPLTANGKVDRGRLPSPESSESEPGAVAPRDETERRLAALWQEVLGQPVGITDDFFALGGQSLLAVRLTSKIREEFGQELLLSVLLEGATVEHLAAHLRQGPRDAADAVLVAIRPQPTESTLAPFFCVHPSGGNVLCYRELATALVEDRGFFGLQSPSLAGGELPRNIEALSETYLTEIRRRQPSGPYLLGGWSMGGVVAFEMARQLTQIGEQAAVLLIDSLAPDRSSAPTDDELAAAFDRDTSELGGDGALPAAELERLFAVFQANYRAMTRYSPEPFEGPVVVFRALEGLGQHLVDASMGWQRWAGGLLLTYDLPGDHYALVRPPVSDQLAEGLGEALEQVEAHLQ